MDFSIAKVMMGSTFLKISTVETVVSLKAKRELPSIAATMRVTGSHLKKSLQVGK